MKVKLDENLPGSSAPIFAEAGHDADTVEEEGLAGSDDPTATEVGRLVVTLDRGFGDVQRYPPGSHAGSWCFESMINRLRLFEAS